MHPELPPWDQGAESGREADAAQSLQPPAEDLIARCLSHEDSAWAEFLHRYQRLIYSTILKVGLPPDEQAEAFQASITAIYSQLPRLRQHEKLISWIVGIAWRQAVNQIRARRRQVPIGFVEDAALAQSLAPPSPVSPPDQTRLELEQAQQAQEAMGALSERCRRLLSYFFYEDPVPDYNEIARREGVPVGSLGPTRARCLEKMRRYFSERGWGA